MKVKFLGRKELRSITISGLIGIVCLWLLAFSPSHLWAIENTLALWHFDEGKGDIVADASENNLEGEQVSCEWEKGKFNGSALRFNQAGSHVEIPHNEALDLQVFTIEFWTKYNKPPAENSSFMSNRGWIVGNKMTGWTIRDHGRSLYLEILTKGQFNSGGGLGSGDWQFIAITYDDAHQAKLYIDGELKKEQQIPGDIIYIGEALWIGAEPNGGYAHGKSGDIMIDEVRISNIARTQAEIQTAMAEGYGIQAVSPLLKLAATWGSIKVVY